MPHYIQDADNLLLQAAHIPMLPDAEIQAALHILSISPVVEYQPFVESEVRLIGLYRREASSKGGYDFVWPSIVAGEALAWCYAVHEARELQEFMVMGANPFDPAAYRVYFQEAHLQATLFELQYIRAWAQQEGWQTSEIALERTHPVRRFYTREAEAFIALLQKRMNWSAPSIEEIQSAQEFWQQILKGGAL